jgi:hypothetical protein
MKDIKALLNLAEPVFSQIDQLISLKQFNLAYAMIQQAPQPPEWVSIGKSEIDMSEYKFNDIELVEGIMYRLFDCNWGYTIINVHTLNDKGRFATTAIIDTHYKFAGEAEYRHQGGVATSYCTDVKALIISSPKSVSQAKKNSLKYIGKLLGLDLNREQEELPIISSKPEPSELDKETDQQLAQLRMQLKLASTKEAAEKLLSSSPFKFYPELKEIVNQKVN